MARTSLAASKAELYGLITTGGLPTNVTAAYNYEPLAGQMQKPVALTISTAGMTAVDYLIALRIYVTAESDAQKAQDDLDATIMAVDARMTSGFGPSNWDVTYDAELNAFVALNVFNVGREDDTAWR